MSVIRSDQLPGVLNNTCVYCAQISCVLPSEDETDALYEIRVLTLY